MPVEDSFEYFVRPSELKPGLQVSVAGYPVEKGGHLYEHVGEIMSVQSSTQGGQIITYAIDATNGQSGSAVHIVDERLVKSHRKE